MNLNPLNFDRWDYEEYCALLGCDPNEAGNSEQGAPLDFSQLRAEALVCEKCELCKTRTRVVFGEGAENARLVFIGEAPGYHEDQQGKPFVGAAGDLLNKMIRAMGFSREQIYIANVLKCRPPENRDPKPEEIEACRPYLEAQLKHLSPRAIVTLGTFATQVVLKKDLSISKLRGRQWSVEAGGSEIAVFPTFHPAFLLRNPERKKDVWDDLQKVMEYLAPKD